MHSPWTISSSFHSLTSLLVEFLTTFIQRGDTRIALYYLIGIGITFFIVYMFFSIRQGSTNCQSRGGVLQQSSVERDIIGQGQGQDVDEGSLRGARRRGGRPSPLRLPQSTYPPQKRSSRNPQISQSPTAATRTDTSGHNPPLSSSPFDAIFGNICLSESPKPEATVPEGFNLGPLPPEILLMILRCVSTQREISPDHFKLSTPLPLRQVCKGWKSIIEETREFWNPLYPPLARVGSEACIKWYIQVTEKLSRMGNGLNSIVLELPRGPQKPHPRLFDHLINLATSCSTMRVVTMGTGLLAAPERRRPSDGPLMGNLKKLEWIMGNHTFADQFPQSFSFPWTSLRQLPWDQLTHITLGVSMTLRDCQFIFNHAPIVEHLELRSVSDDLSLITNSQTETNTHEHIRTLKIGSMVSISSLLLQYGLPQLRCAEFEFTGVDSAMDLPQMPIPWRELTHVSLSCTSTVGLIESIVTRLHAVEELELKGQLPDNNVAWTVSHTLGSLKTFKLIPKADAAALHLMSHFIEHVFPTSIEIVHAPLIADTFRQIIHRPLSSLKAVDLKRHPITPDDFLSFLACSNNLTEGSFRVNDYDNLPSPLSPSGDFPTIISPTTSFSTPFSEITCSIVKLELCLYCQRADTNLLLNALNLPKLSSLNLRASLKSSIGDGLHQLLVRSGCTLSSLSLDCPAAVGIEALELLQLVGPTLESFEIKSDPGSKFDKTLWTPLTHGGVGASPMKCFCPRLEYLNVTPCRDPHSFYGMVESRSKFPNECECGLRKLRSVEAVLNDGLEECLKFSQRLRAKNIECKLYPDLHSDFER